VLNNKQTFQPTAKLEARRIVQQVFSAYILDSITHTHTGAAAPMSPENCQQLTDFFASDVCSLEYILGRKISAWKDFE
jgi:hypothetical protein